MMILLNNESRSLNTKQIHLEIIEIKEFSILFKAVSPQNQGLPFGSRFLAELLSNRSGGHYEVEVLGEGTIGERILARYGDAESEY